MPCPACQREVPADAEFCPRCGARQGRACPGCGVAGAPEDAFCRRCGRALGETPLPARFASPKGYTPRHLADRILTSRSALEGERKTVTVLFCDVVGSTELAARLGADAMHQLVDRFFEIVLREVHRYEGTVNQFLGDGFMALFGAPLAYEDHARRAVLAALGIRHALADPDANAERLGVRALPLRMGLNTGPVVVGSIGDNLRMDYTAVGDTTNLAARMQQTAAPGEICLTDGTHHAVEAHVACEDAGLRAVKGRDQPIRVYRALHGRAFPEGLRRRPITAPLVGREHELEVLLGRVAALEAGTGGAVSVLGEAGVGKSRLVGEARRRSAEGRALWLEGHALSFTQGISYWPFLEVIRAWLGIGEEEADADVWRKLAEAVGDLFGDERDEVLPYVATLLGLPVPEPLSERVRFLDAEALGRRIVQSLRRLVEALARARPLVLVLDDVQWADGSSVELVEHLLPLTAVVPLLLWWKARPDPEGPGDRLAAAARERFPGSHTEIRLAPLAAREARELIAHLMGRGELPPRLADDILRKADGNPFFVEEVIHAMIDLGALARDEATGGWRVTERASSVAIPDTVQGLVMARVDRLDESIKQLLKTAAVIGRSFLYRLVQAVAEARDALDRQLGELVRVELIREAGRMPELTYIFKHALVQEAAYESILLEQRRRMHDAVAQCIERLFPERLDEFAGVLAYHYTRAEAWEKAHEFLVRAGDQAAALAADAEALDHYTGAFRAYERRFGDRWEPRQRAVLERKMGQALFRRGDHARAAEYLGWALANLGARPLPDSPWAFGWAIARGLAVQLAHRCLPAALWRAPAGAADAVARERIRIYEMMAWIDYFETPGRMGLDMLLATNLAERHQLALETVVGMAGCGMMLDVLGLRRLAGYYHRRAGAIAERQAHPIAEGYARFGLGVHLNIAGKWDRAIVEFRRAAEAYRRGGHLRGWGAALFGADGLLFQQGRLAESQDLVREIVRAGEDAGDREVWGWGLQDLGMLALCREADAVAAAAHIERAIELLREVPDHAGVVCASGYLVQCLLAQGNLARARAVSDDAQALIVRHEVRGPHLLPALAGAAALALVQAEQATGRDRIVAFGVAKRACAAARAEARRFVDGRPAALRFQGTYAWLRGRPRRAQWRWRQSLEVAQRLGARYEAGLTHLERGHRTGAREDLEDAERLFGEIGDWLDRARARAALESARR